MSRRKQPQRPKANGSPQSTWPGANLDAKDACVERGRACVAASKGRLLGHGHPTECEIVGAVHPVSGHSGVRPDAHDAEGG